eukprot:CAMPEP_0118956742 /NCGR_PEP_ID=MMETSP1169-20130426/61739_1 /TAXON_ID=36882 /ORGANISM="Pyramimonas obovata, Strain CCMP722" /LENGTH=220 /DNA_ID=CAMNT_0006904789 /DNA_START=577 /DNA_END=1239 /DNA_ORIENTATION=-
MASERQTSDMVRALNMYGVYSFSQLEDLEEQVGTQVMMINAPAQDTSKRPRSNDVVPQGYAGPGQQRSQPSALGHAFQAIYPGQASHSQQDEHEDDPHDMEDPRNEYMTGDQPRPRTYRDPEKRREQNRRASQRARQRARQREEQVVMLQQQLQMMAQEMSTMRVQLDEAKSDVKREQMLASIRANKLLEQTASNPEARSYSFSHPPLRFENSRRAHNYM